MPALLLSVLGHAALCAAWFAWAPAPSPSASQETTVFAQVHILPGVSEAPPEHEHGPEPVAAPKLQATAPARPAPQPLIEAARPPDLFIPSNQLDRPLLPKSEPDLQRLEGLAFTGYPIRLRLFVNTEGQVVDVAVLQVQPGDEDAVAQMKAMFLATAYMPGQLHGQLVPSWTDIELSLGVQEL